MLNRLIDSLWAFRLALALPAIIMLEKFLFGPHSWGLLLDQSGEWAVRMLIITLAVSPIRLIMKQMRTGPRWPSWLFKRRRDMGLASFLYAALHLSVYLVRQANINVVLFDMWFIEYAMGWIAFITMLAAAVTSNDRAVHSLGTWWKPLQRIAYLSAVAAALHWFLIRLDHGGVYMHFIPLLALEAYRIFYNYARPAGMKH